MRPAGAVGGLCVLVLGCARPLLGPEDAEGEGGGSSTGDDIDDDIDDGIDDTSQADDASSGDGPTEPDCHPSYVPCLPVVDELDCPDVVALGAAPVMVVGPDAYGLDADGDGLGCE